ncbi:uncharacterized protein LOC125056792 isoform X2 [Pieris napi]|uniref:uncharacterized protein LOC125056792 isoform X2 n=1 Tax=Pieris napi TaxID=78633 RepID=UPI001FB93118|nr:uncharacterized protein LOC125056792 isoform X2 [Pieris napi]
MDILNKTKAEWQPDSKNVDINEWFLMGSPAPVLLIMATYWMFVIKVGPSVMSKRSPLTLRNIMAAYNFAQIILAFAIFSKGAVFMWKNGFIQTECIMENIELKHSVQFAVMIVHLLIEYNVTKCKPSYVIMSIMLFNLAFFLYLFSNFYSKTYKEANVVANGKTKNVD